MIGIYNNLLGLLRVTYCVSVFWHYASMYSMGRARSFCEFLLLFFSHPTPNITRNITWDPFNTQNLSYLIIDYHSHIWGRYRQEKFSFWDEYLPVIAKQELCELV